MKKKAAQNRLTQKRTPAQTAIDGIAGIFMPTIDLLSGMGILKGLLAALLALGWITTDGSAYQILHAMGDGAFYFMPILLAFTAAKQFGANSFTAVGLACMLLFPSLTQAVEAGQISVFGIQVTAANYSYSVFPILLAVGMLSFVEKGISRIMPKLVRGFMTPALSIVLVGTASLLLLGPAGKLVGDVLARAYGAAYGLSPIVAGIFLSGLIQVLVIFGLHWSLVPVALHNVAQYGQDTILPFFAPPVFAQAGACMALFLKRKDRQFRARLVPAIVSAIFGVTEPAMFGFTLPLKKPLIAVCLSSSLGGALIGISGVKAMAFAFPGLATLPVYFGSGFGLFILANALSMALSFLITLLWPFSTQLPTDGKEETE